MSIVYTKDEMNMTELLTKATIDATLVIPDLQRPYVWSPQHVILLVDSIFKKWPFGTLLLWEVRSDIYSIGEGIPFRPFWQVVDRTNNKKETQNAASNPPATYSMVLDGQQRLQSLLLAIGGDSWGFCLSDKDWAEDRQERKVKSSDHWSKGSLCLDLESFFREVNQNQGKVRKVEIPKILDWVVVDTINDQSQKPNNYVSPIARAIDKPGNYIRLSRLWKVAEGDLEVDEYISIISPILDDYKINLDETQKKYLAEFTRIIDSVKRNTRIHALKINSFVATNQWTKDDYSDAIVNIFTRLNTAGRTLSKEEITLAWIKVGWDSAQTNDKKASECFDDLKEDLKVEGASEIHIDDIVRLISYVWAVHDNDGNLLDAKELLKGDSVRPMSRYVSNNWNSIVEVVIEVIGILKSRELIELNNSFNSIIIFIAWYHVVKKFSFSINSNAAGKDRIQQEFIKISNQFLDKWILSSSWSGVWADSSSQFFQTFAKEINQISKTIQSKDENTIVEYMKATVSDLMGKIADKAISHVNTFNVANRRYVSQYYSLLWIWHRISDARNKKSSIILLTGRKRNYNLDVDHTVANAWWERKVNEEIQKKLANFTGTDEEKKLIAPDGFTSKEEALEFINYLGNCSLLKKSFNISKSDSSLWSFLQNVHNFLNGAENRTDWENALSLHPILTEPDQHSFSEIVSAIKERDTIMRRELVQFINGTLIRQDVD